MAMFACLECGKNISDLASSCPSCGVPLKKPPRAPVTPRSMSPQFVKIAGVILAVVVLLVAWGQHKSQQRAQLQERLRQIEAQTLDTQRRDAAEQARLDRERRYAAGRSEREKRNLEYAATQAAENAKRDTAASAALIMEQLQQFHRVYQVAAATPRIALAPQVSKMQDVLRQVEGMTISGCLSPTKPAMVAGINGVIDGYLAFMRQQDSSRPIAQSETQFALVKVRMQQCLSKNPPA